MADQTRIGIVGASGYAGGELIRILAAAPQIQLTYLTSDTFAGRPVREAFPGIRIEGIEFEGFDLDVAISKCDLLFLAQGSGEAMKQAGCILEAGKKVVDLSADFRLKDPAQYPAWYGIEHADPSGLASAVYGLPELHREEIKAANLVANPGCYPTAAILALAPLLEQKLIDPKSIIVDAKSGISGAGRSRITSDYLYTELNESLKPYAVGGTHRHTPEIEQELSSIAGHNVQITFTPHLVPMTRGLLATCYAIANTKQNLAELLDVFSERYDAEPFVHLCGEGSQPSTKATCGTNQCHIGIALDERTDRIIVAAAIDNLGKGAAGQAVQNMNLMLGLPETHGLEAQGLWP